MQVEIVPFCHEHTTRVVEALSSLQGCRAVLRRGQVSNNKQDGPEIAITDNGNYIIDLHFSGPLRNINLAAEELTNTVGVVEHGLFVNMASAIILANTSEVSVIDCKKKK
jgi:ribose 5-phosphate isomerase A